MTTPKRVPRGIRNNNPGNIEFNEANQWSGSAGHDGRFIKFKEAKWGIRAMAMLLLAYQRKHKLKTLQAVINRWAPPIENNTDSYAYVVAARVGREPDEPINLNDAGIMREVIKAMITVENGQQPYSDAVINEGLKLAGVEYAAVPKPLLASRTISGVAMASGGQLWEIIQSNQDAVVAFAGIISPEAAILAPKILTFIGLAYAAYARIDDYLKGVK